MHAADGGPSSYENAVAAATRNSHTRFVGFESGGHLLLGDEGAAREETSDFIAANLQGALPKVLP